MPTPATNISSGHEAATNGIFFYVVDQSMSQELVFCYELGRDGPCAPARCPKGCPCAKTPCMANDCRQT
eukprot:6479925-Amphidinium_carterae.1